MHAHSVGRHRATTSMIVATADMLMTRVDWSRRLMWTSQTVHSSDPSQLALAIGCAQLKQLHTQLGHTMHDGIQRRKQTNNACYLWYIMGC